MKFRPPESTQKREYYIHNKTKNWNHESRRKFEGKTQSRLFVRIKYAVSLTLLALIESK